MSTTTDESRPLDYTVRRSTETKYKLAALPRWVVRGRISVTIERQQKLELEKCTAFQDVHYKYNSARGRLEPYPKHGMTLTGEKLIITIPAGSKVEYIKGDSVTVCYIANVFDPQGRSVQLAFDKCQHNGYSARITRY